MNHPAGVKAGTECLALPGRRAVLGRLAQLNFKEALTVFDGLAVFDENLGHSAFCFGLDLVHDFHGLNDTDHRVFDDFGAPLNERFTFR